MGQSIFREQSLDRMSSPEDTDQYLKKTGSGTWLVAAAIILLVAAAILWAVTGKIESTLAVDLGAVFRWTSAISGYNC